MKVLFLHTNFPAQFPHLSMALARDPRNQVIFATTREEGNLPGVHKLLFKKHREPRPETHNYLHSLENVVLQGQGLYRSLAKLKAKGFVPDIIYGHAGWGLPTFMKDLYPNTPLMCLFEWFYHAHGTDADFDPATPLTPDDECRIRIKNVPILIDLYSCDCGISPTYFQQSQFPPEFRRKISVIHDGIDTDTIHPLPGAKLVIPEMNLDLSGVEEVVTYVARGMEPYRGFPQFMESVGHILTARPACHVVIVGADRVAYGRQLPDGKTYKQAMLETVPLDMSRVHFTGLLPRNRYIQVLQASTVHVYLTRPFVLSWSMLEAMAAGCLVVGSDTAPVREVIEDGFNGRLVDFFSAQKIADCVIDVLENPRATTAMRVRAREAIQERYALRKMLPLQIALLEKVASGRVKP